MFGDGPRSLFDIGEHTGLLGQRVDPRQLDASSLRVVIDNTAGFSDVEPSSSFVPGRITGVLETGELARGRELAVAINGRFAALTRPFGQGHQQFSFMVPEGAFRTGSNRFQVFVVDGPALRPRLARVRIVD